MADGEWKPPKLDPGMKPGDHPDFFRFPPPPGRSRESTIRIDREGRFWHDGRLVEHDGMARAFASWIGLHPDDGRFILTNGYDWSYFTVEDAPFVVQSVHHEDGPVTLSLSDDTRERLDPETLCVGERDALYCRVKEGRFEARFSRSAQTAMAPLLVEGDDGAPLVEIGGRRRAVGPRRA